MRQTTSHRLANGHSAFTLVELLVVITIIGILAALLIAAASGALKTAKKARIRAEMEQFNAALEDYKNNVGSYPPNAQNDTNSVNPPPHLDNQKILADFKRHLKKVAPSHREPDSLIRALVGQGTGSNPNLAGGMNAAEALVFWLGGFSDDPKYPISGIGGPSYAGVDPNKDPIENRNWRLDINVTQLGPRTDDGFFDPSDTRFIIYQDPQNPTQQRRLNFWYLKAPGLPSPYVYFDASRGSSATGRNDVPGAVDVSGISDPVLTALYNVYAVKREKSVTGATERYEFANDGKFQLLHGGLDEKWGVFPRVDPSNSTSLIPTTLVFPDGPWTLNLADTLTNFSDGTLEDSQP